MKKKKHTFLFRGCPSNQLCSQNYTMIVIDADSLKSAISDFIKANTPYSGVRLLFRWISDDLFYTILVFPNAKYSQPMHWEVFCDEQICTSSYR